MELDFGCFIIRSALNSRSQETENQVFLLKSMGPTNQNFVILSLVITNNKYEKTFRSTSVGLEVHGTNNLNFVTPCVVDILLISNMSELFINLLHWKYIYG